MRTRISSAIAKTLPLLFCLISSSVDAARHRHQQQQHQRSDNLVSSSAESSTIAYNSRTTKPGSAEIKFDVDFDSTLSNTSPNKVKDYMKEYFSRGLYVCTANYSTTLQKIRKLIAEAYAEYKECEEQMKNTPKNYAKTGFEAFDELLDEWKDEDEESTEVDSVEELRPRH